jgi:hypothetical protein
MKAKPDRRSRRQRRAEIEAEIKLIDYTLTGPFPPTITYEDLQMGRGGISLATSNSSPMILPKRIQKER